MTVVTPVPFVPGFRLIDGTALNAALALQLLSTEDAITATAGGGQTNARPLVAAINNVTTVASANDSVALPLAVAGLEIVVANSAAANSMQVFGSGTDTINGVATGTGVAQAAGKSATYSCVTSAPAGKWLRQLSA